MLIILIYSLVTVQPGLKYTVKIENMKNLLVQVIHRHYANEKIHAFAKNSSLCYNDNISLNGGDLHEIRL